MGKDYLATPNHTFPFLLGERGSFEKGLGGGRGWMAAWRGLSCTRKHDESVYSCLPSFILLSGLAE